MSGNPDNKSLFGFLNIYKPVGMTSHDVVSVLRRVTKIKQIGHTGTLDPFAEGVLPICIGKATRLIEYLQDDKEYLATVQFGAATNTFDLDGEKVFTSDKKVSRDDIKEGLKSFEGEIFQLPPIFSAIKVKGKKLYEYARKGEEVEIQPRKVVIENIELKNFDEELQQAQILLKCSKGTYIRSIANDLGKNLGCGGYLIKLIRTQAGKFRIENSVQLDGIDVESNLINPLDILNLPKIAVDNDDLARIKNGMPIYKTCDKIGNFVSLIYNDVEICAVGIADGEKIKLKKVFI
ncbi:tRNA pseudouridine synthase B [Clostridium sp. CAG:715]|nr:tRNA pseudouridine synthase B [Clostridium sp. CAG:715]